MNAAAAIDRLFASRPFGKLAAEAKRGAQFNLIQMLETTVSENAWSRVLAFLFDSRRDHGLGKLALARWVGHFTCPPALKRMVIDQPDIEIVAKTEWQTQEGRRLDILLRFMDGRGRVRGVLGIENKVWAGEADEQVGDYQRALVKAFPKVPKAILFLTPDGGLPSTADPALERCQPLPAGYDTLTATFQELSRNAEVTTDLCRLLESLQNYIRKEITMPDSETKEIKALIQKLYADRSHREAMHLIAMHLPSVRNLTNDIETSVARALRKTFPNADGQWIYEPKRSENPHELKWAPAELETRTYVSPTKIAINFMARCACRNPEIGDEFQFILAAWCATRADHAKAAELVLPNWPGTLGPNLPGCWKPLWVGGEYRLRDLGEKDTAGLTKLLLNGIRATYPKIKSKVLKEFPLRK
jgi:hypothetical protein